MGEVSYEAVLAELELQLDGIGEEENVHGTTREENYQMLAIALRLAALAHPAGTGQLLATALIALYDERQARQKVDADLLEVRSQLHEERAESSNLRVALEATEDDRDEARHARDEFAATAAMRAGMLNSARERGDRLAEQLAERDAEVERLRKEVAEMGAKP